MIVKHAPYKLCVCQSGAPTQEFGFVSGAIQNVTPLSSFHLSITTYCGHPSPFSEPISNGLIENCKTKFPNFCNSEKISTTKTFWLGYILKGYLQCTVQFLKIVKNRRFCFFEKIVQNQGTHWLVPFISKTFES